MQEHTSRLGRSIIVGPMLALVPIVALQGPAHVIPVDVLNAAFVAVYWCWLLARRETVGFPLLGPIWLLLFGSCLALYGAAYRGTGVLTIVEEVYLYVWFVTLAHFLTRANLPQVIEIWAVIAGGIGLLSFADLHRHVLGGILLEGCCRAQGTFENPNMFGDYLVVSFFLVWAAAAAGRRRLYLALPALLAGILATGSNGATLALASGAATAFAWRSMRRPLPALGLALVLGAVVLGILGSQRDEAQEALAAFASRERGEVGGAAEKGYVERTAIWTEAIELIRRAPMGVGPGNFSQLSGTVSGTYNSAHNEYLGQMVERGPLGLAAWCALLAVVCGWLGRMRGAARQLPLAVEPLWGLVAAIAVHALVVEVSHFRHVWFALAVVAATLARSTRDHRVPAVVVWAPPRAAALEVA
jgi:O-antigen ligase